VLVLALAYLVEAPSSPLNSVVGLSADGPSWVAKLWLRNSGEIRELDWWVAAQMLAAHPLTGVGLGNYKLAFLPHKAVFLTTERGAGYMHVLTPRAGQAHSDFVQAAAELGAFGILAVVGFLVVLALSIWRRIRSNPDEFARFDMLLLTAGLAAFVAHALVDFPAHLPASVLAVLTVAGLLYSPAYGDAAVLTTRIRGIAMKATVLGLAVVGVVVTAFGVSDLAANVLMVKGENALQVGDNEEAVTLLEQSIALDFAPRQTYYMLGTAYARLGRNEDAVAQYQKCFTRFVDESVYLIYADLSSSLGKIEQARSAVEFLLSTNPMKTVSSQARYVLAGIDVKEGDYTEATSVLTALVEDAPTFELAYIALGDVFVRRGLYSDARTWYEDALPIVDNKLVDALSSLPPGPRQLVISELPSELRQEYNSALQGISSALAAAIARKNVTGDITISDYGALRQTIATLLNERSVLESRLAQLP
jgi:tetratricopeptide (TPR) repeat protein